MLNQPDLARLILRLALGFLILLHGISKLLNGIGPIEDLLTAHGLPVLLAWGVLIGEILAPTMLILGIHTRVAAVLVAINMVFALVLAHQHELLTLKTNGGWALELPVLFLVNAVVVLMLGPGRYRAHS
ncbi:DoxX family protein [uncultured Halovibrio sp.]|uniref:DoxX family protein n=1 Tax=uncultured Halovibrio sp. TaxID=985049 RepID=UPI0025E3E680|nr:DoxX family protein [uncultured Halovibrio sp.]